MYRKLAGITALVLLTVGTVTLLIKFPEAILTFVFAFALTAAARPVANRLAGWHIPRGLAILLTYLFFLGGLIAILGVSLGPVLHDIQVLTDHLTEALANLRASWPEGNATQQWIASRLPADEELYTLLAGEGTSELALRMLSWSSSLAGTISRIAAVLILSIYWTLDRVRFDRLWLSLLPLHIREPWRQLVQDLENDLGAYFRSEAVQTLLAGALLYTVFLLIGLPFPALLAFLGAVCWLIPSIGPVIALLPVVGTGLAFTTPLTTVLAGLALILVYTFLELVIEPLIFKRRRYSTWIMILFIMALGFSFGVIGMILAPPLATFVEILLRRASQITTAMQTERTEVRIAARLRNLEKQIAELRKKVVSEEVHPRSANLLGRLEALTERTATHLRGN